MNRRTAVAIIIFLGLTAVIIVARRPSPAPSPPAAPEALDFPQNFPIFFPIIFTPEYNPPRGYSWPWWKHRDLVDHTAVPVYYRHFPFSQDRVPEGFPEFIPMISCDDQLEAFIRNYGRDYDGIVLWLNEPQFWGQCHKTPAEAWEFYLAIREACPHCQLVGPNMSQLWTSKIWIRDFLAYGPQLTAVGFHYYGFIPFGNPADQMLFYSQLGLPIWVTEMGSCDPDQVRGLLELFRGKVEVVFYFGPYLPPPADQGNDPWPVCSRLFDDEGNRTAVGDAFLALP